MLYLIGAWNFLRGNWRILAPLAVIAVVLGSLAYANREHDVAVTQKAVAHNATHQADANKTSGEIEAKRSSNTARIQQQAWEARDAVKSAPDIDTAVSGYLNAIDGLRASGSAPVGEPDR
ncbi:MAG: hypothetical protein ACM3YN_08345 [Parcubacteria group bacterium]